MKALIINLNRSHQRLHFQKRQLENLSIEYFKIDAIDSNDLKDSIYEKHKNHWERPLRKSEVACCLSHKKAWEFVSKENKACLILEDDALLNTKTNKILDHLKDLKGFDCISLETRKRKKIISKTKTRINEDFYLHKLIQDKCGAAAYILSPKGAKLLLNHIMSKGVSLSDYILSNGVGWKHGQVVPAIAIQLDCCEYYGLKSPINVSTNINNSKKPSKSLKFYVRRIKGQSRIAMNKLLNIFISLNKEIEINADEFYKE